jgi:hypothetical protein
MLPGEQGMLIFSSRCKRALRRGRKNPPARLRSEETMNDFWIVLLVIGVWFFLQAYLLPRLGINT